MSEQNKEQTNANVGKFDQEKERRELAELSGKPFGARLKWYFSKSGPGWMQSAMTLGGGSAMASLFSGAFMEYKLLWVQPVGMLVGLACLAALAYQTMYTQQRPFEAMKKYLSPSMAWAWAICTVVATIIWHIPQYSLAAGMSLDIIEAFSGHNFAPGSWGQSIMLILLAFFILFMATRVVWSYGKGGRGVKVFERIVKSLVWFIIFSFLIVVVVGSVKGGGINWGAIGKGFLPFSFEGGFHLNVPTDKTGVTIFIAALSSAIGINMTFMFGYSILKKGWTREYAGLQRFDMFTGMLIPFTIATALMIIAAGATIHTPEFVASGATNISPVKAASMLEAAGLPSVVSRLIFGLGIVGMCFNAITMHMVVCGFAVCEMFKIEPTGWKYKLATLLPAPALIGVLFWSKIGTWIAIPTSAIAGLMIPVAYIGFFCLNNSRKFLGNDMPSGRVRFWWNFAMLVAIIVTITSATYFIITRFF